MHEIEEPEQVPPWREEDGPRPRVWRWPAGDTPALYVSVRIRGREKILYAPVRARLDHPDGTVAYHVDINLGDGTVHRAYRWPQPGLHIAHRSRSAPADREPTPKVGRSSGRIDAADA
ncbi:hypothetical protein [Streptomyces rimosus]|uniref:hypothetical protein n=1 Tax=Streptomyces rimosus TaxID=1927 RepID=UPI0004C1F53B|nr:hypothetical protein [Streptomyces rimosus]